MTIEHLANQTQRLACEQQALLGLLLAWVLSPLLDVDRSMHGRDRREVCLGTLNEALTRFPDVDAMIELRERIEHSEELSRGREPDEVSAIYRLDFMAMLYYAIGTLTERSSRRTWVTVGRARGRTPKVLRRLGSRRLAPQHVPGRPIVSCLNRCFSTVELGKTYGAIPGFWDVDGALLQLVAGPQLTSAAGAESFAALQEILRPAFEALTAAVETPIYGSSPV